MALPILQKPLVGTPLQRAHPYARGLRYALLLNEGAGRAVFDSFEGRRATLAGGATWKTVGADSVIRVASASSQYIDCGDLDWIDGATRLTIIVCMSRTSTGNAIHVQKGSTANSRVGLTLNNDGNAYFYVNNGANSLGSVASTLTGRHVHAMRYDGAQSTNATRVRGWIDGVEQTLSYAASTPTTAPTTSDTLRIGEIESGPTYSNGDFYWLLAYDRALAPGMIRAITNAPYAPWFAPPSRYATFLPPSLPPTVTLVGFTPDDGDTRAEVLDVITGDFAPIDYGGNPIDTVDATVNGVSQTVTTDLVTGGEVIATIDYLFVQGRTYDVVWTVTTGDATPNVFTQNFTVRRTSGVAELVEIVLPRKPTRYDLAEINVAARPRGRIELVNLYVNAPPGSTFERCEVDVMPGLSIGNQTSEGASVIAAEFVFINDWFPVSFDTGPGDEGGLPVAFDTIGRNVEEVLPVSMTVRTREHDVALPLAFDNALGGRSEMPLAFDTGPGDEGGLPLAFDTDGDALQSIQGRANLRNEDQATEEDG